MNGLVIGGQLGNYLIESVVGRGGMSVVYRAVHARLGTPIALKVLAPELSTNDAFRERFLREAKMAAAIDHPNVIPIYDTGLHEDSLYIVMRYVAGGDLKALLANEGRLSGERAVEILLPVARALDAAHRHGLVHRDVKPANILLQRGAGGEIEHVYLSDFGITKHASSVSGLTKTGALVGTVDYMAPEQIEGREVTAQTDVYALGCLLYECVTGRVPFERESEASALWAHMHEDVTPPTTLEPSLPPSFDDTVARALAKNPIVRFTSCEELVRACMPDAARASGTREPAAAGVAAHEPSGGGAWLSEHWWQAALVAVVVLGGVVAAIVALSSGGSSSETKAEAFPATLAGVPTNRVTGTGNATVRLDGAKATITVDTNGLLDAAPHAMHIHAGGEGKCPPASASHLHNGNRAISTVNGEPFYGPPVSSITTKGDISKKSILAFPRFPHEGAIRYGRTMTLPADVAADVRDRKASVIVHGIDYNDNGLYDSVLDRSELDRHLPGEATAPALCGRLVPASTVSANAPGDTYAATLRPTP